MQFDAVSQNPFAPSAVILLPGDTAARIADAESDIRLLNARSRAPDKYSGTRSACFCAPNRSRLLTSRAYKSVGAGC